MEKYLNFDMDGTIYNLYKIPAWLDALRANEMDIFSLDDMARKSLPRIREAVRALIAEGWHVGIITWAPIGVEYGTVAFSECEMEKMSWLERNFPEIDLNDVVIAEYGENKHDLVKDATALNILVDDNKLVREAWRGAGKNFKAINASRGYVKELVGLVG